MDQVPRSSGAGKCRISDRPDVFAGQHEIPIEVGHEAQKVSRRCAPGDQPIVELDDHNGKRGEPVRVFREQLVLGAFNIDFADERLASRMSLENIGHRDRLDGSLGRQPGLVAPCGIVGIDDHHLPPFAGDRGVNGRGPGRVLAQHAEIAGIRLDGDDLCARP